MKFLYERLRAIEQLLDAQNDTLLGTNHTIFVTPGNESMELTKPEWHILEDDHIPFLKKGKFNSLMMLLISHWKILHILFRLQDL